MTLWKSIANYMKTFIVSPAWCHEVDNDGTPAYFWQPTDDIEACEGWVVCSEDWSEIYTMTGKDAFPTQESAYNYALDLARRCGGVAKDWKG